MKEKERIEKSLVALRESLALLQALSGPEEMRVFFAALFARPSAQNLADFADVVTGYRASQQETVDAINAMASKIAGATVTFTKGQIVALHDFFTEDGYIPIQPVSGAQAAGFQEFYENLFSKDQNLVALRDLQKQIGTFWGVGGQELEQALIEKLSELGPNVQWDARYLFGLISLLTVDFEMKELQPWAASASIW